MSEPWHLAFYQYVSKAPVADRECTSTRLPLYMHCGALRCEFCYRWHMKWVHACPYELDLQDGDMRVSNRPCLHNLISAILYGEEFDLDAALDRLLQHQAQFVLERLKDIKTSVLELSPTWSNRARRKTTIEENFIEQLSDAELRRLYESLKVRV